MKGSLTNCIAMHVYVGSKRILYMGKRVCKHANSTVHQYASAAQFSARVSDVRQFLCVYACVHERTVRPLQPVLVSSAEAALRLQLHRSDAISRSVGRSAPVRLVRKPRQECVQNDARRLPNHAYLPHVRVHLSRRATCTSHDDVCAPSMHSAHGC